MRIVVLNLRDVPTVYHGRGRIRGAWIELPEDWDGIPPVIVAGEWPDWAKALALAKIDGERGVGDTAERLIGKFGGRLFKAATKKLGIQCGCGARKADWNARYPYDASNLT